MNPTNGEVLPPVSLPEPQVDSIKMSAAIETGGISSIERGLSAQLPVQQQNTVGPGQVAATQSAATAASSANSGVTTGQTPLIADDVDLIEKEWVIKAKHIVDQTKSDPHLQNKEISKMKADYLKKRYNRDVKLAEE